MAEVGENFWAELAKNVAGDSSRRTKRPALPVTATEPPVSESFPEAEPVRLPVAAPEWSGVLDLINGARVHAEAQRDQLLDQADAFQQALHDLREEAEAIRQQVRVAEARADEAKTEAERYVSEILTQAEQRMRDVQAKADEQIAEVVRSLRQAEARAATAEGWLQRIQEAAISLAPRRETVRIQRAA